MQPLPPKASPYVCCSAQCDLLDVIGTRRHPFSFINAQTTLKRGRQGVIFECPPPTFTERMATVTTALAGAEDEWAEGEGGDTQPRLRTIEVDGSGHALFASGTDPPLTEPLSSHTPCVLHSGWGAAMTSAARHFAGTAIDTAVETKSDSTHPLSNDLLTNADTNDPLPVAGETQSRVERVSRTAPSCTLEAAAPWQLPTALLRRALLRALLLMQLPGRSPVVALALLPCQRLQRHSSDGGDSEGTEEEQLVRFRVTPDASRGNGSGLTCCLVNTKREGHTKAVHLDRPERMRAAADAEGETVREPAVHAHPIQLVPASSLEMQCMIASDEAARHPNFAWLQIATVTQSATLSTQQLYEMPSEALQLAAQELLPDDTTTATIGAATSAYITAKCSRDALTRVSKAILHTLFRYTATPAAAATTSSVHEPAAESIAEAVTAAEEQRAAERITAPALDAFLQGRCFALLSLLAHRAWCQAVARELVTQLLNGARETSAGVTVLSAEMEAVTAITAVTAGSGVQPRFVSLVVLMFPSTPQATQSAMGKEATTACETVVRVTGASVKLHWRTRRPLRNGEWVEEQAGSLQDLSGERYKSVTAPRYSLEFHYAGSWWGLRGDSRSSA